MQQINETKLAAPVTACEGVIASTISRYSTDGFLFFLKAAPWDRVLVFQAGLCM